MAGLSGQKGEDMNERRQKIEARIATAGGNNATFVQSVCATAAGTTTRTAAIASLTTEYRGRVLELRRTLDANHAEVAAAAARLADAEADLREIAMLK